MYIRLLLPPSVLYNPSTKPFLKFNDCVQANKSISLFNALSPFVNCLISPTKYSELIDKLIHDCLPLIDEVCKYSAVYAPNLSRAISESSLSISLLSIALSENTTLLLQLSLLPL